MTLARSVAAAVVATASTVLLLLAPGAAAAQASPPVWAWPVDEPLLLRGYEAPAHRYGAGHRGIDVAAEAGAEVRAVGDGTVRFAGTVAGRPVISIDHGDGLVSSVEPVVADVVEGSPVRQGDRIGTVVDSAAHLGRLHLGARLDGEYLSPLALLGGIPRAVLLPLD